MVPKIGVPQTRPNTILALCLSAHLCRECKQKVVKARCDDSRIHIEKGQPWPVINAGRGKNSLRVLFQTWWGNVPRLKRVGIKSQKVFHAFVYGLFIDVGIVHAVSTSFTAAGSTEKNELTFVLYSTHTLFQGHTTWLP